MTGIPVSVAPPTADGRLYPLYWNSLGILTLGADGPRPCPFGITIDGRLILDFDEAGILANVELVLPRRAWKGKADTARPDGTPGNILLPPSGRASANHGWPIAVSKDVRTDMARIVFGSDDHDRAVHLSDQCSALLRGDRLTGFWFSLAR